MDEQTSAYSEAAARVFAGEPAPRENPLYAIGHELLSEFKRAEADRRETEERWLKDLRQYKGLYEPEEEAQMQGSKAFLRKTRVKVESVDARMIDLLFPANRERNYDIKATPEPSIPKPLHDKIVRLLTQTNNGQTPPADKIKKAIKQAADNAAAKMATRIDDQLAEARYRDEARKVLHSGNLYGTGIMKGPLVERRQRVCYKWDDEKGRFAQTTLSFTAPMLAHVPIWRWYPDMAVTDLQDSRYTWEHHRLGRSAFAELATRPTFNKEAVRDYIKQHPDGRIEQRSYEGDLRLMGEERTSSALAMNQTGQYDVFERWGWINAEVLCACGHNIPDDQMHEAFFANIWLLPNGEVIKAVLTPIEGMRWPYHLYYLDKDETSIFGEGFASIMRSDQTMINAAVRMLLDNAAVGAGPMFEVYAKYFPPTANLTDIHALKVFPRTDGDPQYPAVRPISANTHINELMALVELFDNNADETTAIPKFTYGDNPRGGAAGTMGGLSMLLGQANIALKDLVLSWDEGVTKGFISGMYHWNMRFSLDDTIKGDYDVVARGAASLVAKEVRGQALNEFGQNIQPEERPYVKWGDMIRQKAECQELADVVMSDEEFMEAQSSEQAKMAAQMQQMAQQLQLATAQAKLAEVQAKANKTETEALNKKVEAVFAAMQAAGVAAANPSIAPAGDAILQSAGWKDATPQQEGSGAGMASGAPVQQAPQVTAAPEPMPSPHEGQTEGIETAEVVQ